MAWVQTARPRTATAFAEVARAPPLPADGSWAHPEAGLLVSRALEAIGAGALDKVVLARAIDVEADAPLDAEALLRALEARYPTCRAFLVRGSGGVFFLGATPEILCRVEGDRVEADALAG